MVNIDVNVDIGNTMVCCQVVNVLYHCKGFCIMLRGLIVYEICFVAGPFKGLSFRVERYLIGAYLNITHEMPNLLLSGIKMTW
jgi:hypothetical protein